MIWLKFIRKSCFLILNTKKQLCCLTRYEISVGKVHIYKKQHIVPQC